MIGTKMHTSHRQASTEGRAMSCVSGRNLCLALRTGGCTDPDPPCETASRFVPRVLDKTFGVAFLLCRNIRPRSPCRKH